MKQIVLLDLFSGTGGFAKGLKDAGFKIKAHYFSEIDKYAIANYRYNFKGAKYVGKVEEVRRETMQKPDIITFGFPCQDISIAGTRQGLKGERSGLFFEAMRIISTFKPSVFIFENVKGLFSSNEGKDFEVILKTIADLGVYECEWQLLNSRWFLPQNRERVYFVGHLRGKSKPKVFPLLKINSKDLEKAKGTVARCLTTQTGECTNNCTYVVCKTKEKSGSRWVKRERTPQAKAIRKENMEGGKDYTPLSKINGGKAVGTLIATGLKDKLLYKNCHLRKLTPLECERLQGFSQEWTKYGLFEGKKLEISDRQRYRLTGNAVSVPVVKEIGKWLLK